MIIKKEAISTTGSFFFCFPLHLSMKAGAVKTSSETHGPDDEQEVYSLPRHFGFFKDSCYVMK